MAKVISIGPRGMAQREVLPADAAGLAALMDARIEACLAHDALPLGASDKAFLLRACRLALENHFSGRRTHASDFEDVPASLKAGGARVFVSLYNGQTLRGCCASQSESVLQSALDATRRTIRDERHGERLKRSELGAVWVDLNILLAPERVLHTDAKALGEGIELGVHAIGMEKDQPQGRPARAFFKANVPVNHGYTLKATLGRLARKAGIGRAGWQDPEVRISRYDTLHFREVFSHRFEPPRMQEMFRAAPVVRQSDVTRQNLERSLRLAGDYLANHVTRNGRMTYEYDPQVPERRFSNSTVAVLRRLAATWVLADTARYLREPRQERAARRSLEHLAGRFYQRDADAGIGYLITERKAGIGAAGFMLATLSAINDEGFLPGVREELARYILSMEDREGGFFYPMSHPDKHSGFEGKQLYYPGEAMTGLMALHARTGDDSLLEPVQRVLPYYRDLFRRHEKRINMAAWMSKPYAALFEATGDRAAGEFVLEVCDEVTARQLQPSQPWFDRVGGFSARSNYCAAAVFLEAVAEGCGVARKLADRERMQRYQTSLLLGMRFLMQGQYGSSDLLKLPDARFLAGGVRTTPLHPVVRVDNVQHAACAIRRTLDCLDLRYSS
ncbi:AMMECR1 domain-containing protein [Thioalkalivibrio sp. ALJ9]|uniref:AMMECR1 domain-containing protein n=1 Tax=Thioalkalivibrio sp. ALJ9 TaxID=1158758 RepID=UPI00037FCEC6|nr:AMMECR1 domain-containing protein [Thioalkalivibrio sp. ALJ9]